METGHGKLHGRRSGRPLRASLQRLIAEELPRRVLAPPAPGERLDPFALFSRRPREVWLEVGFGGGEHLAAQAAAHPEVGIIGAEVFRNGVATLLRSLVEQGSENVRILGDDARLLLPALPPASLQRVFLLFPDPWPKTRHHKRRFVQRETLDLLAAALADEGEFRLASDDPGYLAWMLRHLLDHPAFAWTAERALDWRERPADWPQTRYEAKAIEQGRRPAFLRFRRCPRRPGEAAATPDCP